MPVRSKSPPPFLPQILPKWEGGLSMKQSVLKYYLWRNFHFSSNIIVNFVWNSPLFFIPQITFSCFSIGVSPNFYYFLTGFLQNFEQLGGLASDVSRKFGNCRGFSQHHKAKAAKTPKLQTFGAATVVKTTKIIKKKNGGDPLRKRKNLG